MARTLPSATDLIQRFTTRNQACDPPSAPWAEKKLTPAKLERVKAAGLDEYYFLDRLTKGSQLELFDIERFVVNKTEGARGTHTCDFYVDTQRGEFPTYDVAVALKIFGKKERVPAFPWTHSGFSSAPASVKQLIEWGIAWRPPAAQPSPPTTKKPRSEPRRSARFQK